MNRLGIAEALRLVAAGFAIGMTLIFRIAPVQWVVTIAIGVIASRTVDPTLRGGG